MYLGNKNEKIEVVLKMDLIKDKIFKVVSRVISVQDFEQWVYTNSEITNNLENDDFFFELVSLNYRGKHALYDLEKTCFKNYDYEEYLINMIEMNCQVLILEEKIDELWKIVLRISSHQDWDKNYKLIYSFYGLEDEISLAKQGFINKKEIINYTHELAQTILSKFEKLSLEGKKDVLINGELEVPKVAQNSKKWYHFWK